MSFDPSKPVQTRDGREAGIYHVCKVGLFPIHGYIVDQYGIRELRTWTRCGFVGRTGDSTSSMLVNVNVTEYPPLPEVEGGILEYRGKGWSNDGRRCKYYVQAEHGWEGNIYGIPSGCSSIRYAEFTPDEMSLIPYTLETFPMWAVWVRVKGIKTRSNIREVTPQGITLHLSHLKDFTSLITEYEIAGTDGIWHPAGQEVAQ